MKNKFKNQRGVISVFAMLAMLFFLLFIIGAYTTISRKNKVQKQTNADLIELYSTDVDAQSVYDSMVAKPDEVVPVKTFEQLDCASDTFTGIKLYSINGKVYYYRPGMHYEIKSNISVSDRTIDNYEHLYLGENTYVNKKSMYLFLDGENNLGNGHDKTALTWVNLADNGPHRAFLYSGGSSLATGTGNWADKALTLSGAGEYMKAEGVFSSFDNGFTLEMVIKPTNVLDQAIIGTSHGGLYIKNDTNGIPRLVGELVKDNGDTSGDIVSYNNNDSMEANVIQHVALTYDGRKISVYRNGSRIADNESRVTEKKRVKTQNIITQDIGILPIPHGSGTKDYDIVVGLRAYIGKEGDTSRDGITLIPYFVEKAESYPVPYTNNSYVYENGSSTPITDSLEYYREFVSIRNKTNLRFIAKAGYRTPSGGYRDFDFNFGDTFYGTDENSSDNSFSVLAVGSDSFIVKSNVGPINEWYNGDYYTLNPSRTVELFGTYYYEFSNLTPNTEYIISGRYSTDKAYNLELNDTDVYIGRCFDGIGKTFSGQVYSVRVYNSCLTEDYIKTNYNVDRVKFSR